MNKIEINIDSTSLSSAACIKHFILKTVGLIDNGVPTGGFKEHSMGIKLVYGICIHKFIDVMYKTGENYVEATVACKESFNSFNIIHDRKSAHLSDVKHLLTSAYGVWDFVKNDSEFDVMMLNDKPATEITFSLPYFEDEFVKINLCGTIDRIGKIRGGCYCIRDWKTTSSWDNVGYFKSYELSKQLRVYTLACKMMSKLHPDSVLGKIGATNMGAMIDAVFIKSAPNDNVIKSSQIFQFKDKELDEFDAMLKRKCVQISNAIEHNFFPKEGILTGSCELRFGKCMFWNVCAADDSVSNILLNRDFVKHKFDPLKYNEIN
jgi:hypothetical protein